MTTIQQPKNKVLTAKQYEFYKRKGMTDDKVMKLHGFNNASFYAWKEQHNLKGVKFEKDVKVTKSNDMANVVSVESEPQLKPLNTVHENKDVKARLQGYKLQLTQDVTEEENAPCVDEREETIGALSVGEPSLMPVIKTNPDNTVDLVALMQQEQLDRIKWLEERHVKDTEEKMLLQMEIKTMEERHYKDLEWVDHWCNKARNFERELNKVNESHSIKVSNLNNEIKKLDQALQLHAEDETLLFLTMQKAVQMRSQVTESVEEGGRSTWI